MMIASIIEEKVKSPKGKYALCIILGMLIGHIWTMVEFDVHGLQSAAAMWDWAQPHLRIE